jgi:hypothetical protein
MLWNLTGWSIHCQLCVPQTPTSSECHQLEACWKISWLLRRHWTNMRIPQLFPCLIHTLFPLRHPSRPTRNKKKRGWCRVPSAYGRKDVSPLGVTKPFGGVEHITVAVMCGQECDIETIFRLRIVDHLPIRPRFSMGGPWVLFKFSKLKHISKVKFAFETFAIWRGCPRILLRDHPPKRRET